jgi:hypothetical protein
MVDFKIEPYIVVTIRSYQHHKSIDAFLRSMSGSVPPGTNARMGPFLWSNGVLFGFAAYAPSESLTDEYLKGHLPWDHLDFAVMESFQDEIHLSGRETVFVVKDVSDHSLMGPLGIWIYKSFVRKKTGRESKPANRGR